MILKDLDLSTVPPGLKSKIKKAASKFVKKAASDGSPYLDEEVIHNAMWQGIFTQWDWTNKLFANASKALEGVSK